MYLFLIILVSGLINTLAFKDLNPRDQKDDLLYYKKLCKQGKKDYFEIIGCGMILWSNFQGKLPC